MSGRLYTGGCLCGAVRYRADSPPQFCGLCYCADCRKASGSGFVGFMSWPAARLEIAGPTRIFAWPSARGTDAVRTSCTRCASLVFGGEHGKDDSHTIYAGSLDDPSLFHPTIAIFTRDRPAWAALPEGLTAYETMPA